ncbi:MAG: hypothetical protein KME55_38890, partial [Nostoc indistinguendum CM1-VF10]|nr:hypothetical protein [Nostoc indistinguendum CM1-VF10]
NLIIYLSLSALLHFQKNGIVDYYFLAMAAPAEGIAKLFDLLILTKGLSTVGHTGTNAWGENDLCLDLVIGSGKLTQ